MNEPFDASEATDEEWDHQVAKTIMQQVGVGSLMTVGARNFAAVRGGGLYFEATILPLNGEGERLYQPTTMMVVIQLNASDYYDTQVVYLRGGELVVHDEQEDLDCTQISRYILALDSSQDETPLNPSYWP